MDRMKKMSLRRSLSLKVGSGKKQPSESAYTNEAASAEAASSSIPRRQPRSARKRQSERDRPAKEVGITIDAGVACSESRCGRERKGDEPWARFVGVKKPSEFFSPPLNRRTTIGPPCSLAASRVGVARERQTACTDGLVFPRFNPKRQHCHLGGLSLLSA